MTKNVLEFWQEIQWIVWSSLALLAFAVTLGIRRHRGTTQPGSKGHRVDGEETAQHESIRPDGYIDTFAGVISEAGGGVPPVVKLILVTVLIWWAAYIVIYWTP